MLLAGSPIARWMRGILVLPIARLAQDGLMFGVGFLIVLGWHEHATRGEIARAAGVAIVLMGAVFQMLVARKSLREFSDRSALSLSGRLFCVVVGLAFVAMLAPYLFAAPTEHVHAPLFKCTSPEQEPTGHGAATSEPS